VVRALKRLRVRGMLIAKFSSFGSASVQGSRRRRGAYQGTLTSGPTALKGRGPELVGRQLDRGVAARPSVMPSGVSRGGWQSWVAVHSQAGGQRSRLVVVLATWRCHFNVVDSGSAAGVSGC